MRAPLISCISSLLQVWNEDPLGLSDDKIGTLEIKFRGEGFEYGKRAWYDVDTGGQVACTVWVDKYA